MSGPHKLGLRIIAVGKLGKALTLTGAAIAALLVVGHDPPLLLHHIANGIGIAPGNHLLQRALVDVAGLRARGLEEIALGCFVYASLFTTEGVGLWFEKTWAEYLSIAITTSFVPLEIYELAKHPNVAKVVMLVLNVAAAAYLVVQVRADRRRSTPAPLDIASR